MGSRALDPTSGGDSATTEPDIAAILRWQRACTSPSVRRFLMRNARSCGAVALLSFALFLGCSDAQDDGADNGGEAVTGGQTDVAHGSVGYLVVKDKNGKKLGDCSATLVGPNLVITAA